MKNSFLMEEISVGNLSQITESRPNKVLLKDDFSNIFLLLSIYESKFHFVFHAPNKRRLWDNKNARSDTIT